MLVIILLFALVIALFAHTIILTVNTPSTLSQILMDYSHRLTRQTPKDKIAPKYKARLSTGVTSLAYILTRFGDTLTEAELLRANIKRKHTENDLVRIAAKHQHKLLISESTWDSLPHWNDLPAITPMRGERYLVIHHAGKESVIAFDPVKGTIINVSKLIFLSNWTGKTMYLSFD